jgi:pimeloyl-ACP methyl ester carboxylesterase
MACQVKKELGLERPVYIGHSWGAWLGLLYAAVFPDQVWLHGANPHVFELEHSTLSSDASILEYFDTE